MNGFIYPLFNSLINFLYYTNLVELFKFIGRFYAILSLKKDEKVSVDIIRSCSTIAIDIYQIFKWGLLVFFWLSENNSLTSKLIIYYLIYSNLFVYFYYHTWGSKYKQRNDREALKKNFLNYLMAIAFYLFSYAYLYKFHYNDMILIDSKLLDISVLDSINAIYLSISTAFTLTFGGFQPLTQEVRVVFLSELINTFLFFTIIVSNSIPSNFTQKEDNELQK
ncbi:MAG: hypothetical protein JJV95_00390 [Sulfurospirillum sp.]|nr:hypothetical protein [Sulfurospirillum sp.]